MSSGKMGMPTPTNTIVHRLRLMGDSGGVLTRDRIRIVIEAADRLEQLYEQINVIEEKHNTSLSADMFP